MLARTLIGSVKKEYGFAFDTIIEKYKDLNPEVHLPDERGYELLNDGDYFVTLCGENNLSIQFSDCITVFFGGWFNRFIDAVDAIKVIDEILSRTLCVYCGELCSREVIEFEIKKFVIVRDPFDKYCLLKIVNQEYDYSVLEKLTQIIKNPYE